MPPRLADLVAEVASALSATAPSFRSPTSIGRAYEAYCYSILLETFRELGFTPFPTQLDNGRFLFPLGPRSITDKGASFFRLVRGFPAPTELELHSNLYVLGTSGHRHEVDVAVVDSTKAETCRTGATEMTKSGVWVAAECKCYDSRLGAGIGRGFLGLAKEIGGGKQEFILMTSYPWSRRVVFDIVRVHGHRFYRASPQLVGETTETRHALRTQVAHLVGR